MINDKEFEDLLKNYYYSYKQGDIIQGQIIAIEKDSLLVDINSKTVAICPISETVIQKNEKLSDVFEIGKTYEFAINSSENEDGVFYLSHRKVALAKNIEILKEKQEQNETLTGIITNISKGGIIVNVMGIKGFVPLSQLRIEEKIGQEIELKILTLNPKENNFIFSNKKVYDDEAELIKKDTFEKIELNMVIKGTVVRLTDFGAFIDIGGIDGLLPLSQISWRWIDNPSDVLKCGEKIDVEIIGIDKEKQRVSLSYKTLSENPWPKAKEFIQDKKEIKGKVTRIKTFGAFVEIYPQVEGLLNRQQLQEYSNKYKKNIQENDEILVNVKKLDVNNQKINLEIV